MGLQLTAGARRKRGRVVSCFGFASGAYFAAHGNSYFEVIKRLSPAPPPRPLAPARAPKRMLFPGGVCAAARGRDPAGWLAQSAPSLRVTCVPPSPLLMHVISLLGVAHARATSLGHAARGGAPAASPPAGCPLLSLLRWSRCGLGYRLATRFALSGHHQASWSDKVIWIFSSLQKRTVSSFPFLSLVCVLGGSCPGPSWIWSWVCGLGYLEYM